jgi:NAD(P)-dependent dehydrogenase (short-subunit alcohol dehydrogenase family)
VGKVAIVTGGGMGIGRSACQLLAPEGAKVTVTAVSGSDAVQSVEDIRHGAPYDQERRDIIAADKVRVNSVHPGFTWTPLVEKFGNDLPAGAVAYYELLDSKHALGRVANPDDVRWTFDQARSVLWAATGRKPTDSANVCEHGPADSWAVSSDGIAEAAGSREIDPTLLGREKCLTYRVQRATSSGSGKSIR